MFRAIDLLLEIDCHNKCCSTVVDAGDVYSHHCTFFTESGDPSHARCPFIQRNREGGPNRRLGRSSSCATADRSLGSQAIVNRSATRKLAKFCSQQYSEPEAATIRSPVSRKPLSVRQDATVGIRSQMIDWSEKIRSCMEV
jgi:hypothetical protein